VRGLDKQWWPFSAEASLCVAAAMQHAAARGLDGGAVLLPARRTDNGADDRARGDAMDADDRACGDAMDADDRMCGDASENGSGRTGPPQLEVRWGRAAASEASGASGSPTGMLQVNLDHPNVVAIVRRDRHDPSPGSPPAYLDWGPPPTRAALAAALWMPLAADPNGPQGGAAEAAPAVDGSEFTGGAGVLLFPDEAGVGFGASRPSRLEVLALWQPARLPLAALFPACAHDDGTHKALVKIAK
jgi:hypothetical protein